MATIAQHEAALNAEEIKKQEQRAARTAKRVEREAKETLHRQAVDAENARLFAEATANYKDRLFAVLVEFATLDRFSVWKKADKLVLKSEVTANARYEGDYEHELSLVPKVYDDLYALEAAESDVREHYEAVAEEARLQDVRKAARAKLSDEEASALGLK